MYSVGPNLIAERDRLKLQRKTLLLLLVIAVILLGSVARVYRLTSVPSGLHRDEMSEMYEAYSLLKTGADRWGWRLPVYFLSWGSGQNVLQSYLSVPVVAFTGLSALGTRFVTALFGILLLPLFFMAMRRWHGTVAAFAGLVFLAFSPWHVMLSRWGIENNQLPFLVLLGMYSFSVALESRSRWLILCSLLPFALALYSYGVFVAILPTLFGLLFLAHFRRIHERWKLWTASAGVFLLVSAPIAFFVLKNYITKRNYAFERYLPVSVPLIPVTRLSQARGEINNAAPYHQNLRFVQHAFQDPVTAWYNVPHIPPLPLVVLGLALIGMGSALLVLWRERRYREPFGLWFVACLPLFALFPLNVSRAIALFLPIVAMAGVGFRVLWERSATRSRKGAVIVVTALLFLFPTVKFLRQYFGSYYANAIRFDFHPEMPEALEAVNRLSSSGMPMYITDKIWLTYVDVLYYRKIDPSVFQRSGATWKNPDFGRYHFDPHEIAGLPEPFAFLLLRWEPMVCAAPRNTAVIGQFVVGVCGAGHARGAAITNVRGGL